MWTVRCTHNDTRRLAPDPGYRDLDLDVEGGIRYGNCGPRVGLRVQGFRTKPGGLFWGGGGICRRMGIDEDTGM